MVGGERIEIKVTDSSHLPAASEMLGRIAVGDLTGDDRPRTVVAPVSDGVKQLAELLKNFEAAGIGVSEAVLRRPTLDDVFLALTGASTESREVEEPQLALESGRRGRGRGLPS